MLLLSDDERAVHVRDTRQHRLVAARILSIGCETPNGRLKAKIETAVLKYPRFSSLGTLNLAADLAKI